MLALGWRDRCGVELRCFGGKAEASSGAVDSLIGGSGWLVISAAKANASSSERENEPVSRRGVRKRRER